MKESEDYEEKIEQYLRGEFTDEEEADFMHQLNINEKLRKQYEEELMVRAWLSNNESVNKFDSLSNNTNANLPATSSKKKSLVFFIHRTKYIAAAIILIITSSILLIIYFYKQPHQNKLSNLNNSSSGNINKDSVQLLQVQKNNDSLLALIFKKNYTSYIANNDPVTISNFYNYYKSGMYDKVIIASKKDYQAMSVGNSNSLNEYMQLYKGLAYLAENNPNDAITKFNLVLQLTSKTSHQYFTAQWYYMLALLKKGNISEVKIIANNIASTSSPYKSKALQIIKDLK